MPDFFMPNCVFAPDNSLADILSLEADFVRFFLKELSGEGVKLYLMLCYLAGKEQPAESAAALAEKAGLTEKGLYLAAGQLEKMQLARLTAKEPPVFELRSVRAAALLRSGYTHSALADYQDYFSGLRAFFPGREFTEKEMETALEWVTVFGLTQEAAMLLVQQCREELGHRVSFRTITGRAKIWSEKRLTTPQAVEGYLRTNEMHEHRVKDVLLRMGLNRLPTLDEIWLYEKWVKELNLAHEAVLAACAGLTRFRSPSFANLDKLINEQMGLAPAGNAPAGGKEKPHKQTAAHTFNAREGNDYSGLVKKLTELEEESE